MWQAPNQRVRALAVQKKRERERMRRPFHVKRVSARLELVSPTANLPIPEIRLVLNDMSPKGVGVYSTHPLKIGMEVVIVLDDSYSIRLKGRLIWCQEHTGDRHVLTDRRFTHRFGIQFKFDTKEEEQAVEAFCQRLANEFIMRPTQPVAG